MAIDSSISESLQPDPEPDPSKRPDLPSPISPSSKGKAPMGEPSASPKFNHDEGDSYSQARCCGVCLSEEGSAVRGCIDSCDHYFCFLCIIEWSKIESRCPLCKQRFGSIRRMRTDGSFIGDRAVIVPVRNQIYDPQRNTTSRPVDPYSDISCSICAASTDENLLLLCDLCDTAMHTYCAGLGATIPEGDWFCQECTLMKAEELNSEPTPAVDTEKPSVQAPVSIFDIVGEPDREVHRLSTLFSSQQQTSSSSANTRVRSETKVSESSVRTLNRCRDVHKYIRGLRENWDAIRSGSLSFPSRNFDSGATNNSRVNNARHGSNDSAHGETPNKKSPYDVDRAWKMFNIAKSKQTLESCATSSSTSRNLSRKVSSSKDSKNLSLGASSKSVPSKSKNNTFNGVQMHQSFNERDAYGPKGSDQHNNAIVLGREKITSSYTRLAAASPGKCTSSNKNKQKPIKSDVFPGRAMMSSQAKPGQGLPHVYREQGFSSSTKSLAGSLTWASGLSCTKLPKKPVSLFEGCSGQTIDSDTKHASESNQLQKSADKRRNAEDISVSSSNKNTQKPIRSDDFHGRVVIPSQAKPGQGLPVCREKDFSFSTKSLAGSLTEVCGPSCTKLQKNTASSNFEGCSGKTIDRETNHTGESNQLQKSGEKRRHAEDIGSGSKRIKVDPEAKSEIQSLVKPNVDPEAKSEIQSLVKLNLKLLSSGKKLEVDLFKDIARRSTHEILGACGLEPPKHNKTVIPKPICSHSDQNKSSMMPGSCRECFFAFVKDVVSAIMSKRIST